MLASGVAFAGPKVLAVRAWPGKAYTRITIESDAELKFFVTTLANPDRAVIDLSDVAADAAFQQALSTLRNDTGVLTRARIGQFRPDLARLVLELNARAETAAFVLPPVGQYKHRLVIDLTPRDADDPIAAFLAKIIEREAQLERAEEEARGKTPIAPPALATPSAANAPIAAGKTAPTPEAAKPPVAAPPSRVTSGKKPVPAVKPFVVVLDPGHGGEDPGAIGPAGTYEKDVVLAIAHKTRLLLEQDKRIVVFMTREEDVFIPLADRVKKARGVNADVFVSIHADAFTRPDAAGSSVYALSERGATSAAARWIADKENQSDLIGGVRLAGRDPALAKMILEMSQSITNADSLKLARGMIAEIQPVNQLHKKNVEQAGFAVLRSPDVPSILIETAFISNPVEEKRLASASHQLKLARAIRGGIRRFLLAQPVRS
ncbi:MAG: N-acetylmuramoyl-L-alanine amidase [Betaproteobacteria bacterium]|nr:MAG: N-acetylmuramoyl-L-alanine amidase [Betaproteobacteria bacterium]